MNTTNSVGDKKSEAGSTPIAPGAQPLWLSGGSVGVLIVHGFGGSIGDYREFATELHRRGYTVSGPRLAGHGQGHRVLRQAHVRDWQASIEAAGTELKQHCPRIFIVGASFGGALALDYAARHPDLVTGVIAINTPVTYRGGGIFQSLILRLLRVFTPYYTKPGLSSTDRQRYAKLGSTLAWPIDGILETQRFMTKTVLPALPTISVPALLMANHDDPHVSGHSLDRLNQQLGSRHKQTASIPGRTHRPFRDPAATHFMIEQTDNFIRSIAK